jgi:formylglycine-generating enzyme required for sulfatase activity
MKRLIYLLLVFVFLAVIGSALGAEKRITNSMGLELVLIPAGSFMMGSPPEERGRSFFAKETQHQVTITKPYYLQTTVVTQGQWKALMGNNPSYSKNCGDDCPVDTVSWNEAQEFIGKLNQKEGTNKYRLPLEAEWEYAARAGTTTRFYTGNCISTDQANYDGDDPLPGCPKGEVRKRIVRVKSFEPNAFGLYDMHGNIFQWCQDWYDNYPSGSVTDPTGPSSGMERVMRGGSWFDDAGYLRAAYRSKDKPGGRGDLIGFRIARDL